MLGCGCFIVSLGVGMSGLCWMCSVSLGVRMRGLGDLVPGCVCETSGLLDCANSTVCYVPGVVLVCLGVWML